MVIKKDFVLETKTPRAGKWMLITPEEKEDNTIFSEFLDHRFWKTWKKYLPYCHLLNLFGQLLE